MPAGTHQGDGISCTVDGWHSQMQLGNADLAPKDASSPIHCRSLGLGCGKSLLGQPVVLICSILCPFPCFLSCFPCLGRG